MLLFDALVIVGFSLGALLLYRAFTGPAETAAAFALLGIGSAVIPLPIAIVMHNQIIRRRLTVRED